MSWQEYLTRWRPRVDDALERLLPPAEGPAAQLHEAMRYAVLAPGKRLRPILVIAACEACGGDPQKVVEASTAVELVHAYSLVHDDLPAMDDDDLRRGRKTVHRVWDEATAILVGDAALSLAFEVLTRWPSDATGDARADSVATLARDSGGAGMVGGQVGDILAEGRETDASGLEWIHRHKTGCLFAASVEIGAIHAGASAEARAAIRDYGHALGLAFQIADDLLDLSATAEQLGKTPGKDLATEKSTYPALLGVDGARRAAAEQVAEAAAALDRAGAAREPLHALARFAAERES